MPSGNKPEPSLPALVAMVHLPALPGSPGFQGSMQAVIEDAVARAELLTDAGFAALLIENFGDAPFFADAVPPVTVAAVTRCVEAVKSAASVPVGVNVLRNDALAALAISVVTGAAFIRVNVLTGVMFTDQGPIVGRAAELLRRRAELGSDALIWADVLVKHAVAPAPLDIEEAAADAFERGGADALVVSGPRTGAPTDLSGVRRLREAVPEAPVAIGSGASPANLEELAQVSEHIIVGTSLEESGRPGAALDPARVEKFMTAAAKTGLA